MKNNNPHWIYLLAMMLAACGGKPDTSSSGDRFTGFTQVGSEGESKNLYIDPNSASRAKDGWVNFKMVRVIVGGYAIQDAMTDCRNSFLALEGVKFNDEGTSNAKFPGNTSAVTFTDQPGLVAAVQFACDKAEEKRMIIGQFDDIKALELVYGPYRPDLHGSTWDEMDPPAHLDGRELFLHKTGIVRIKTTSDFIENGQSKRILITSAKPNDDSADCHPCGSLIGAVIFIKIGDKWRLETEYRYLGILGAYGEPPELSWRQIGKNHYAVLAKIDDVHQGIQSSFIGLYELGDGGWKELLEYVKEGEEEGQEIKLDITFDSLSKDYADATISISNNASTHDKIKEVFYYQSGKYLSSQAKKPGADSTRIALPQTESRTNEYAEDRPPSGNVNPSSLILGMIEASAADNESSIFDQKRILEALPKKPLGNKKLGRESNDKGLQYFKSGQYALAIGEFLRARNINPADIEIINNLGYSYLKSGDIKSAHTVLVETLIAAPGRASAWANLAEVYGFRGDIKTAVACLANTYRFSGNRDKTHQFLLNEIPKTANPAYREALEQITTAAVGKFIESSD